MSAIVTVASREIVDYVHRSCRVTGLDAGVADRIARNVTLAEILFGGAVQSFCAAASRPELGPFIDGPGVVLRAEADARMNGSASADFAAPTPIGAVTRTLWNAAQRGAQNDVLGPATASTLELSTVALRRGALSTDVLSFVDTAQRRAAEAGIAVGSLWWNELVGLAKPFLVAESTLDALD